jgi:hypothetical protein
VCFKYLFFIYCFYLAPYVSRVPHFSSEVFLLSPLRFRGVSLFIGGLFLSPLCFRGASFFIGGLFS